MRFHNPALVLALSILLGSLWLPPDVALAQSPLLEPNDRLAILGGTFVERMQSSGALEAELQTRRPDWKLRVRNLGWSGDDVHGIARKVFDQPEDGFKRLLRDVDTADPTVVLVAYGFAEASDGAEAVDRFDAGLRRLVSELTKKTRRVILLSPMAMPGVRVEGYDRWLSECRQIVARVAEQTDTPPIALDWVPATDELTEDRLHPSGKGYAALATSLADELVGGTSVEVKSDALVKLITDKNQLFFHRYRPQNETYLFLFRKHEQGNNAVEIPQFDPLIEEADRAIWQAAGDLGR
jgi:lysophospholipase L1-like esterase